MKTFILTAVLLAFANTSFALEAYVGVHGGSINYDKAQYSITTNPGGASIGVTQDLGETPFFVRLEAFGTEHALSPSAGIGVKLGGFTVSAGLSSNNEERARYTFGGIYSDGYSTDKFTSKFIEVEKYNIFARYSEYDVAHNFVGSDKTNPFGASATKSLSLSNSVVQVGYRYKF